MNSAAVPAKSEVNKRDILSQDSVERPSAGNNSSISLIDQGRIARVNNSSAQRDYQSVGGVKTTH